MCLKPGEEIGEEYTMTSTSSSGLRRGGVVMIDGVNHVVEDGSAIIVPNGANHNVINTSKTELLKLYTIYSPPEHRDGVIHKTREEAMAQEEHFDGKTTE